ncbi:MAG: hypothetical protein IPG94_15430 [Kineosporiaceae bacterium]|nr:hypothetical protein [Kineosporiaceae bacterium]
MNGSGPRQRLELRSVSRTALRPLGIAALVMIELLMAWDWQRLERPFAASALVVPLLIVAGFAALSRRDRHPVAVFTIVMIISASAAVVPLYHPGVVPMAALYAVSIRCSARTARIALGTTILMFLLISLLFPEPDLPLESRLFSTLGYAIFTTAIWVAGRHFGAQARTLTDVTALRAAAVDSAVAAERLRLARELHDIVSHAVSIMVVQAGGARRMLARDPQRAEQALYAVEDVGREAMDELRRLLTVLRSAAGDQAAEEQDAPGLDALAGLVSRTSEAGIATVFEVDGEAGSLAPSVELTAYRVVQEALTNTVKHAGPGATARVQLSWQHSPDDVTELSLRVSDQRASEPDTVATGPTELSIGLGLAGLAERVTAIGGRFSAHPTETGYLVQATLPATRPGRLEISLSEPSALGAGSRLGMDGGT